MCTFDNLFHPGTDCDNKHFLGYAGFVTTQIDDDNAIFKLDGAPHHYAETVSKWLNKHFIEQWIGIGLGYLDLWTPLH